VTTPSPRVVQISLWLFVLSFVPGLVSLATTKALASLIHTHPAAVALFAALLAIPLGIWGWVAYLAYHRKNWARWLHCVILVGIPALYLRSDPLTASLLMGKVSEAALWQVIVDLSQVAAGVLLILPQSNRWYATGPQSA
jgi:hypothetical protein